MICLNLNQCKLCSSLISWKVVHFQLAISNTRLTFIKDTMLKIHFANKTFTYLNEYMTFNQTIYNNYIFLKQAFVSVKVSENIFIMGVTIFLYLSQLQKLTVACYSFFMKNFDYRCNNIFVLVTITTKKTTSGCCY